MVLIYLFCSALIVLGTGLARSRKMVTAWSSLYYVVQAAFAAWIVVEARGTTVLRYFTFDDLGLLFHVLMAVISAIVFYQSIHYLNTEGVREFKIYNLSLIALCFAVTGVYYADNAALTWIFIEATTLATAGLVYHRRTVRSLEATWKYLFVCSLGIVIAYLGILMISTAVTGEESLTYDNLAAAIANANPLYMKMAFLFVLTGYSCKMEIFPLYSVGVDANYAAPTPASALISTALVNAGFVAFFRVYRVLMQSEVYGWVRNVLLLTGIVSVLIGAIYLRRTNNYKRFMTYSTVENMGIVMLGLGLGGPGVFAAIFHLLAHSLLKSGFFMQIAQVGRIYKTYRMNRIGNYLNVYRTGGIAVILGMVGLLAFPPSGLFISELIILKEMIAGGNWVLLAAFLLLVCLIIYTLCRRFLALTLRPAANDRTEPGAVSPVSTWLQIALIGAALAIGVFQPAFLVDFINGIIS